MNAISQIRKIRDTYEIILENGIILNVPELFVLDFDGADGISYRNAELNISVDDITVAASLEAETQTILLNQLNDNADGVFYITSADAEHLQLSIDFCSTIYVGDTDDLDVLGGAFSGIAETTGAVAVANKADNAFVLTNRIGSVEELAAVIAHEAGLLAGTLTHDYTNNGISIDDFMNHPRVVISAGQSSTFTNETFSGLVITDGGGAILNSGSLTVDDGTFEHNRATSRGGAIYNSGATTITGATFSENRADSCGGAIFNAGSTTITNATFTGNSASKGGAIDNEGYLATLNISDATFSENRADDTGGAIYHEGSATITNATFNGNRIDNFEYFNNYSGGASFNDGSATLNISGATFTGNYAFCFGGAVFNAGSATITGAIFSGNSADMGGAIFNAGSTTITNATFTGNSASKGGAIDNEGYLATLNISGATFSENRADDTGGAIYHEGSATITNATFNGNRIDNFEYFNNYSGGAIFNDGSATLNISGATFTGNYAFNVGGAVFNAGSATIIGAIFSGNSADMGGAAIFNAGSTAITNATFSGNSAKSGGAIYNTTSATMDIGSATFSGNSAKSGGAIYNTTSATMDIGSATFSGNSATNGGAVYNTTSATMDIGSATFSGNSAANGGAIFNAGPTTINSGAAFSENRASYGGAIFNNGSATLNISGAIFSENSATSGGAVYNEGSATITNATFNGNRVDAFEVFNKHSGGAIFNDGSATLNISGATFSGNRAHDTGGAIFNNGSATLNISGATFSGNRADYGGAIYNEGSATITNAIFNGNRVDDFEDFNDYPYIGGYIGGAIFNAGSATLNISGAAFSGNRASYAGAINNEGSATITNATFTGNSAKYDWGAIFNDGSATITNATFSDNDCGAIYNMGTINLKGIADLQTDMDTWINDGNFINGSFVNWDLTAGTASYGTIRNFQYYSNADTSVTQKITVGNTQNSGIYTLATGDMSDWDTDNTGKYNFNITGISGLPDVTITIGETKTYNGLIYILNIDNNGTPDVTTDDKLVLALDNGTTGFINTSYTGAPGSTTSDGHIVGVNAFTSLDAAIEAGGETIIQTGGTYGNGSTADIFAAQGKTLTVQTAAYNTNTILAGGKHSNTAASRIWVYESGATNLTIDGGTFQGNIIGADVCTTGSQQRTGDVNMTIHGGNFTTTVAGGMYYRSSTHGTTWEQKLNSVNLIGNVNLMIDGGSFAKRVYGGNFASNDKWGGQTLLDGSINLTIDASDAITFKEHVIAGSRGEGCISGNVNVTVTGNGANLNFANGKYLFGASGAAYYKTSGGVRSEVSYVDGTRNLVFNDFQGQFSGKIGMFQKITFSGDTQMSFKASQNVSLSDISSWELNWDGDVETYADLTGVTNTFAGDTVNINFDSASTDDALLTGAAGAFASLTSATVKFNDTQVAFDDAANGWVSGSNKLYISDDGTQLKMTTIA